MVDNARWPFHPSSWFSQQQALWGFGFNSAWGSFLPFVGGSQHPSVRISFEWSGFSAILTYCPVRCSFPWGLVGRKTEVMGIRCERTSLIKKKKLLGYLSPLRELESWVWELGPTFWQGLVSFQPLNTHWVILYPQIQVVLLDGCWHFWPNNMAIYLLIATS